MSETTTTGDPSKNPEADKTADKNPTGGDSNTETGNGSEKKIQELESSLTSWSQKTRKLDKTMKDFGSKLDAVLSKLGGSASDPDDDDPEGDDLEDGDGGEGGEGGKADPAPKGGRSGERNPEVRSLLKKLSKERTNSEKAVTKEREEKEHWRGRFLEGEKRKALDNELSKFKILQHARPDLLETLERKVQVELDDEGAVEVSHPDYPTLAKFLEEYLNDRPHLLENTRASGTGDDGGAERTGSGGAAGSGFPANWNNWTEQRRTEWFNNLTPERRREIGKKISL